MSIEKIIVERFCPACDKNSAETLFTLVKRQFLSNNPTYNLDWFEKIQIPDDYQFPFLRCSSCGFVYSKYRFNDEANFQFYNEGINLDKSREKVFKKAKRVKQIGIWLNLVKMYQDKPDLKLLDYGGGWGDFLAIAKSYGVEVFGLEFDERKIAYARMQGIQLSDLSFLEKNAPYDLFMCNQVMEHLDRPQEALQKLRKLVFKGSVGYMSVPNFDSYHLEKNIQLIKQGGVPVKEINPFGHLNYFSPETFSDMLNKAGFAIVQTEQKEPMKLTTLLKRMVTRNNRRQSNGNQYYVKAI